MSNLRDLAANPQALTIHPLVVKEGWKLKRLSQKHKTIIALHVQNVKREEIGAIAGCTPEYVSMIVKQPLAQEYLTELETYMDSRMKVMYGKAVEAIDECLDSGDEEIKLRAAKLTLEANGKMQPSKEGTRTAEDVVASILRNAQVVAIGGNVQVNTYKDQGDE